jgi:ribosomal protein S18 acetylase RimI-like enzyme
MGLQIRRAGVDDVEAIVGLHQGLFAVDGGARDPAMVWHRPERLAYFTDLLTDDGAAAYLAEADGEPVGFVSGRMGEPTALRPLRVATLESMFVREEHRRGGVGEQLTARFLAWAHDQGADRVTVSAFADNDRAIAFYRRVGFTPRLLVLELDPSAG